MDRGAQWATVPGVASGCCDSSDFARVHDSSDLARVHMSLTLLTPSSAVESWLGASCPQLWSPMLVTGHPT